jgi:hypothetical protein
LPADDSRTFSPAKSRRREIADLATVAAFLILLGLPAVGWLVGDPSGISTTENRRLASRPALEARFDSWASFPRRSEQYVDDHLGFRRDLIRTFSRFHLALFGASPAEKLVAGREGWLFYGDRDAIAHYRRIDPLGPGELKRWQRVLEERRDWLAERGIAYLVVLVPDKHEIYAEYMPASLPVAIGLRPLDQLVDHMVKHSEVEIIDLRKALEREKKNRRVYQRTGTHWNEVGAYSAYRAILARLRSLLPSMGEAKARAVEYRQEDSPGLGLASLVGLEEFLREEALSAELIGPRAEIAREHRPGYAQRVRRQAPFAHGVDDPALPRAVMFRDSFGNALIPYLSEHFRRILYVWDRDVDPSVVAREKPDVVIQQIVSRLLERRPRSIAVLKAQRDARAKAGKPAAGN